MSEAIVTSKGQITIPKSIRRALKLKTKDKVVFVAQGNQAIMVPAQGSITDLYGSVKHTGKPIDFEEQRRTVAKTRAGKVIKDLKG
jgi:AbrB family looped-hinge helix DNA binding protein